MTVLFAKANHNWSARATNNWTTDGGTTYQTPTTGDTLVTNNYTITIDETTAVMGELKNGATTSGGYTSTAGGKFSISGSYTLKATTVTVGTATLVNVAAGATAPVLEADTINHSTTTASIYGVDFTVNATFNISGIGGSACALNGGTVASSSAANGVIHNGSSGTLNIIGNGIGGSASNCFNIYNHSVGTINVIGNVGGGLGTASDGAHNRDLGILTITGDVTGGCGTGSSIGVSAYTTAGTITINGNVTGGNGAGNNCYGAYNQSGTITVNGNVIGGNSTGTACYGAFNGSTGTITVNGAAIGNDVGPDAPNSTYAANVGLYNNTRNLTCTAKAFITGKYGCPATGGYGVLLLEDTSTHANNYVKMFKANGTDFVYFEDPDLNGDYPAEANVRNNTTFAGGSRTGSLVVPPSTAVASGVATDATVGSAVLTEAAVTAGVWDANRSGHTTTGTFGEWGNPGILSREFPRM